MEALARWRHPTEGVLPPSAFLRIADELNVVGTIDRMVLEQTIEWLARWEEEGLVIPKASVNVSARRLNDESLIESLRGMSIEPGRLSRTCPNPSSSTNMTTSCLECGLDQGSRHRPSEIDDFAPAMPRSSSLLKLKPRRLKIDRQFNPARSCSIRPPQRPSSFGSES